MGHEPDLGTNPMAQLERLYETPRWLAAVKVRAELRQGQLLAVLDTSSVRTGLDHQVRWAQPPRSIRAAREGTIKLFMEKEAVAEVYEKLPLFAQQLDVTASVLTELFGSWLPHINVVALPTSIRELDARAQAVAALDPDDYPTAALAALLSPCILLTHNVRDFAPLGMTRWSQGTDAIIAAVRVEFGDRYAQAAVIVPASPFIVAGSGVKWAADRIGPWAYVLAGLFLIAGAWWYARQPAERRAKIKKTTMEVGEYFLTQYARGAEIASQAQDMVSTSVVPPPEVRTPDSGVMRALALAREPMSAQRLHDAMSPELQPSVVNLRRFLHDNKADMFSEARRGAFTLGRLAPPGRATTMP
jgi:hypothetical protein